MVSLGGSSNILIGGVFGGSAGVPAPSVRSSSPVRGISSGVISSVSSGSDPSSSSGFISPGDLMDMLDCRLEFISFRDVLSLFSRARISIL